jgi:predicted nucleotide-binding protein
MSVDLAKPLVFVGSSTGALRAARAIQSQLQDWDVARVRVWQDLTNIGIPILDALIRDLASYDFAVMIVTADEADHSKPKNITVPARSDNNARRRSRENVLLEFGLFAGRLGRENTFLIVERDVEESLPSDLGGLIYGRFNMANDLDELKSQLGPACNDIAAIVGKSKGAISRMDKLARRVDVQASQIEIFVRYFMSASIFHHLCGIGLLYRYDCSPGDQREYYFLRDTGLIEPRSGFGFLDFPNSGPEWNVADAAKPTPIGWMCIKLRREGIPPEMLDEQNRQNLRMNPETLLSQGLHFIQEQAQGRP